MPIEIGDSTATVRSKINAVLTDAGLNPADNVDTTAATNLLNQAATLWDVPIEFVDRMPEADFRAAFAALETRLVPYLGQVSTRGMVKSSFAPTNKQIMSRSMHFSRQSITELRLVFSNWYMKTTTPCAETLAGGVATVTASIEYPKDVFTRVTFSGLNSGSIPDGEDLVSDPIEISIPNNVKFWVRNYYTNAAGIPFSSSGSNANLASDMDTCQFAASGVPDQTMGGNINNSGGNVINPPTALLAMTRKRTFLLLGDSRTAGVNDSNVLGDRGVSSRSIADDFAYINMGSPTERATEFVTTGSARRLTFATYCTDVICGYGINDIMRGSRTKAQLVSDVQSIRSSVSSKRFYALTLSPETTGSWGDAASQVTRAGEANRVGYNTDLRNGAVPGLTGAFDITVATEDLPTNPGKWKSPGYTTDGVHESPLACAAIKDSGVISV